MANRILVFDKIAFDPATNQYFQLILIDGTTVFTAYIKDVNAPTAPGLASAISSVGAIPIVAPSGFGNVTGSGTTGQLTQWTDGPNSIIGDSLFTQTGTASINLTGTGTKLGIHRAVPSALLHVDGEGQTPASVGTTPGTAGVFSLRTGSANVGGDTTIITTGVGGTGGQVSLGTGTGGQASAAAISSTGGDGGAFNINTNAGGQASVAGTGTNTGGNGGAVNIGPLGSGGAANGNTSGANLGGNGGGFFVTGGTGGAATVGSGSLTGGLGGSINFTGGTGGAGATANGAGGAIVISGGKSGGATQAGGVINFRTSINNGTATTRLQVDSTTGAVNFFGPLATPSTGVDTCRLWEQDAAAGDGNLFALNEAGKNERLTGLASRITTQFDVSNTQTPANITGLTFNVEAGKIYSFEANIPTTSDIGGGVKVAIGGTCTASAIGYEVLITNAGLTTQGRGAALGDAVGVTAVTVAFVEIKGTITVANAGTLTVQGSRNAATATTSFLAAGYFKLIPQGN